MSGKQLSSVTAAINKTHESVWSGSDVQLKIMAFHPDVVAVQTDPQLA